MTKRPCPTSIHRQSIRPSTRFKRLPVWVSKADIVAYLKLSPTNAQALIDSADRRCLINGVEKIPKYKLQTPPYPDLIRVMQRHPSHPSIRRLFRAVIEKILRDPTHPSMRRSRKNLRSISQAVRDEHPSHGQRGIAGSAGSSGLPRRVGTMVAAATPNLTTHPVITMTTAIPSAVSRSRLDKPIDTPSGWLISPPARS